MLPPPAPATPQPERIDLAVVYEDDDLVVLDKPPGLVVHPAAGHASGTLVNALIAHCGDSLSGIGGVKRPGIVHRLDKDTCGLLVVAKNDRAHRGLPDQFADHGRTGPLERAYLAIVWGVPERRNGASTRRSDAARTTARAIVVTSARAGASRSLTTRCWSPFHPREEPLLPCPLYVGDRAHSSNSRAYGAYRPSAFWGSTLRIRFQNQSQPAGREAQAALPRWVVRRFTRRCWASSTRRTGICCGLRAPCPPIWHDFSSLEKDMSRFQRHGVAKAQGEGT